MLTALSAFALAIALTLLGLLAARRQRLAGDAWLYTWVGSNILLFAGMMAATGGTGLVAIIGTLAVQMAVSVMAPALYLFAWAVTRGGAPPNRRVLAAAPVAITLAFLFALAFMPIEISSGRILVSQATPWLTLLPLATLVGNAAFPLAALRRLHDHRKALGRAPARAIQSDLSWVKNWALAHLGLLIVLLAGFLLTLANPRAATLQLALALSAQAGLIGYVGFRGLTRSHIFFAAEQPVWRAARLDAERRRTVGDFDQIKARLAEPEVHTDPELNAARFAELMGWGRDRVNEAIRAGGATSFAPLLAEARVETVKRWALDPDHQRIALLTLAMDAGFGSKSAFYDAFKAREGVTPSVWKRAKLAKRR